MTENNQLEVTFLNVEQGDSIILSWTYQGVIKFGMIDACLKRDGANPALEYIVRNSVKEFEFIIMSHPHLDHFSGLHDVLEYCKNEGVLIKRFLHTSEHVPEYLRMLSNALPLNESKALYKLFAKLDELQTQSTIERVSYVLAEPFQTLELIEGILNLYFHSPSSQEKQLYLKQTPVFNNDVKSGSFANWISTLITLEFNSKYIVLTSDCPSQALKRVGIENKKHFQSKDMILGQIPHHGSKGNHYPAFWNSKKHVTNCPVVVSVGQNSYEHPSKEVIDFFTKPKNSYLLYSTNLVGALHSEDYQMINQSSDILDFASTLESETINSVNQYQGDHRFTYTL